MSAKTGFQLQAVGEGSATGHLAMAGSKRVEMASARSMKWRKHD